MAAISTAIRLAGTIGGESAAAGAAGSGGMQGVTQAVGQLGGSAGHTSESVTNLTTSLISAVHPLTYVNKGLDLFKTGLTAVLGPMDHFVGFFQELNSKYVGMFDPGRVKLFDMATRDLYAVIGEMLTPFTREATSVIKEMSAILNGLTPYIRELVERGFQALKPAIQATMEAIRQGLPLMIQLADLFNHVFMNLTPVGIVLGEIASAAVTAMRGLSVFLAALRSVLGLPQINPKDATGKAAANVGQTNVQGYLSNLQLGALRMGKGEDPAAKAAGLLGDIKQELITLIANLPDKIKAGVTELPAAIGKAVVDGVKGRVDLGKAGAQAAGNALLNKIPAFVGG